MPSWFKSTFAGFLMASAAIVDGSALAVRNTTFSTNQRKSWNVLTNAEAKRSVEMHMCLQNQNHILGQRNSARSSHTLFTRFPRCSVLLNEQAAQTRHSLERKEPMGRI